MIYAQSLKLT